MESKLDPGTEHLFSRAGRMIALANIHSKLDHPGVESIDIKRADCQIKAINAIEKLSVARDIESRMEAIEEALANMTALIASQQGNAGRINMETPQADPASGGTDPRN